MSVRITAATIVARNYIAYARVWARSFREHHPGARIVVLLVDRNEGVIDAAEEPFELLEVEELGIDGFRGMAFRYDVMELSTAVKPALLERLLDDGTDIAFYFDPDILVLGEVRSAVAALDDANVVLTPHALSPPPVDGRRPSDAAFLVSGAYNLGFIGVRKSDETARMLRWWRDRLVRGGASAPERGLFTDQKWIDLVPSYFDRVAILRDPTLNIAYWNLHERAGITERDGAYLLEGEPIRFFHFSGFDPANPEKVSKHQDRFTLASLSIPARQLFARYARAIADAGWDATRNLPYTWGRFDDGDPIAPALRKVFRDAESEGHSWLDPFSTGPGCFRDWAVTPGSHGQGMSPLGKEVWNLRPDVRAVFPRAASDQAADFISWLAGPGADGVRLGPKTRAGLLAAGGPEHEAGLARPAGEAPHSPPRLWDFLFRDPALLPGEHRGYVVPPGSPLTRIAQSSLGVSRYRRVRFKYWCHRFQPERALHLHEPPPAPIPGPGTASRATRDSCETITPVEQRFGVNVFGYLDTESGVGEVARCFVRMLEREGVPVAPVNIPQSWLRREDHSIETTATSTPYPVNLFFVNADQLPAILATRRALLEGRRNVGYWFWELEDFPETFAPALNLVDEVWVASTFCQRSISERASVPVVCIPPAIDTSSWPAADRAKLGLSNDDIVFLHVFDAASVLPRKNPEAAIAAFKRAFPEPGRELLLLKTINASRDTIRELESMAGRSRVTIMNGYAARSDILTLHASSDVCVSLHRSEGLGLTLIESMAYGHPVIATAYGGCADFLRPDAAALVPYRRITVGPDAPPYPADAIWADPCVESAAAQMRRLATDRAAAASLGARGRDVIRDWAGRSGALARARIAALAASAPAIS